jgi:hypothetical protein
MAAERIGMTTQSPPAWAERVLRLSLEARTFEHVAGDLLEQYRDAILPARGVRAADAWYVSQVLGFVWRGARGWALLFAAAFVLRAAFDWLAPTTDFHNRAAITTYAGAAILFAASFWPAWRSGQFAAGPLFGLATAVLAAPIKLAGIASLLLIWHDPATLSAIAGSGGLEEDVALAFLMIVPAIVLGTIAGLLGSLLARGANVTA